MRFARQRAQYTQGRLDCRSFPLYLTHMLDRLLFKRLKSSKKGILLLGPRQVGKSTLTRSLKPDLVINLADEELYLAYSKDPARLKREIAALEHHAKRVVIDEIQRIPTLLNSVQFLLDEGCTLQFVLTGSSARKLKQRGVNLLPGRLILEHLDPLLFWELGDQFDLEKALRIGTLPGVYLDKEQGPDILSTYATTYLREEIQHEAATRNVGSYARFLDCAAESSGCFINYSKIASDTEIPKETIRRYFDILSDTLIVFRIPPYTKTPTHRNVSQRDRFVFFDMGVRNAVLGIHTQRPTQTQYGTLFEQWFILQCIGYMHAMHKNWKISSYRTDSGTEVDLILETHKKIIAIECKWATVARESHMPGLRSFEKIAPQPLEKYLVYRGSTKQKFKGGEIAIPYQTFLHNILPSL